MAYIDNVTNILQIQPDGLPTFVRLSQNENGRNLYFQLAGNEIDIPANATITISGTKPDGTVYSGTGSISDNVILIPEMIQMTAVAGYWDAKVKIISGGNTIATGRIRFVIDADTVDPDAVPSDSELEGLVAEAQQYAETARTEAYGSPLTAQTAAGMTDHTRVYVYTGSETGYTAGHWYYWDGTQWTDGGIYNSTAVNTDPTLTLAGVAADAKATGDAIEAAESAVEDYYDSIMGNIASNAYAQVDSVPFVEGMGYDYTGISVGSTMPATPSSAAGWNSCQYECQAGDVFIVTALGGSNMRTWGFTDKDRKLLSVSASNAPALNNSRLYAQSDGYLYINCASSFENPQVIHKRSFSDAYPDIMDAIEATDDELTGLREDLIPLHTRYDADTKNTQTKSVTTIEWTDGHFYNLTTGEYSASPTMKASPKYDCAVGDVIVPDANRGQILFFASDGSLSSPYVPTEYPANKAFAIPANTVQFAFNNANADILATSFTHYVKNQELAVKSVIAPARVLRESNAFVNKQYVSTANGFLYKGDNYASWYCAPFISVESSHKYRTQTQTHIVFYDASMAFISALLPGGSAGNTGVQVEMDFTTPATCKYISINSLSQHEILFDVDTYDIVGQIINPQKLMDLRVLSFGDSILGNYAFGDNISSFVEDFTGAKTYNCGFGGCRMELLSGNSETAQITNPFAMCSIVDEMAKSDSDSSKWSAQDAAAATFEQSPRYNRIIKFRLAILKTIDITNIDIVTIAFGTNEIGYTQENQSDTYDKYTFGGATRYAIEKLLEINPKLRIVLLTPIYRHDVSGTGNDSDSYVNSDTGLTMADNINTLKAVGLEYKMPVIDMYHDLGINSENYLSYFGDADELQDGTHINSYGRKMYGLRLAGELNRLF